MTEVSDNPAPYLSPDQLTRARDLLAKHQLAKYESIILRNAIESVSIIPGARDQYDRVGNTRFGGVPDLPQNIEWPRDDGKLILFIGQVNLAELPPVRLNPLPSLGMLYFFYTDCADAHRVIYFEGDDSQLVRATEPAPDDYIEPTEAGIPGRTVRLMLGSTVLGQKTFWNRYVRPVDEDDEEFYYAFEDHYFDFALDLSMPVPNATGNLLGHPIEIGYDKQTWLPTVNVGDPDYIPGRLLISFDGGNMGYSFGDAGFMEAYADIDDQLRCDFSRTNVWVDSA